MPMFVVLGRFTDDGAKNMPDLVAGVEQNMARAASLGITQHGWYMTQGQYDFVVIAEAPEADTLLKQEFGVAASGVARTETMRAYTIDEVRQILG